MFKFSKQKKATVEVSIDIEKIERIMNSDPRRFEYPLREYLHSTLSDKIAEKLWMERSEEIIESIDLTKLQATLERAVLEKLVRRAIGVDHTTGGIYRP